MTHPASSEIYCRLLKYAEAQTCLEMEKQANWWRRLVPAGMQNQTSLIKDLAKRNRAARQNPGVRELENANVNSAVWDRAKQPGLAEAEAAEAHLFKNRPGRRSEPRSGTRIADPSDMPRPNTPRTAEGGAAAEAAAAEGAAAAAEGGSPLARRLAVGAGLGLGGLGLYHYGRSSGEQNARTTRNLAFGGGVAAGLAAPRVIRGIGGYVQNLQGIPSGYSQY
jgi:hypothetical protein